MIALVLGLGIVVTVATLSLNNIRAYRSLSQAGEQIENGRYALKVIGEDLEHAGFFGLLDIAETHPKLPAAQPDPCVAGTPVLQNYADSFRFPITNHCGITLNSKLANTNNLVLLRAGTKPANTATGDTYIQTTPNDYIIGKGSNFIGNKGTPSSFLLTRPPDNTPAIIRNYSVRIYYLRSYSQTSGDNIPTLMRKIPSDNMSDAQAIIEGIENMQIQYGLDGSLTSNCNNTPTLGDGSPDGYYPATSLTCWKDWSNIVAVRIFLLSRSLKSDPAYTDTKSYNLGNVTVTPGGNYRRRVFTQTIRLANIVGIREK